MNTKKVNVQMLEPQPTNGIRTIDTTSSQTIAKPNVRRSIFFWFKKEFSVLTIEECLSLRLEFSHNIYGDSINQMNCRSVWHNYKGKSYRCDSLYGVS